MNNKIIAILWLVAGMFFSNLNDVLMKYLGNRLPELEIVFFRFAFSTVTILPFLIYKGKEVIKTNNITIHIARGLLLFSAVIMWCYGLQYMHISTATLINFTVPIFVLILAHIFLKEEMTNTKLISTLFGFLGIFVVITPITSDFGIDAMYLIISSILFALLDVINKKYSDSEPLITMVFYSSLVTTLASSLLLINNYIMPTTHEFILLLLLGAGANLVIIFMLIAFRYAEVSFLSPFKYIELVFSIIFGYILFAETPTFRTVVGALIIIPSTLIIAYFDNKIQARSNNYSN